MNMAKSREELREVRKQMIGQMEQKLHESWSSEEDSLFYYHRSEERIVLSHALFWVMTKKMSEGRSKMTDVRNECGQYFSLIC